MFTLPLVVEFPDPEVDYLIVNPAHFYGHAIICIGCERDRSLKKLIFAMLKLGRVNTKVILGVIVREWK
jgi:hypothetical protein